LSAVVFGADPFRFCVHGDVQFDEALPAAPLLIRPVAAVGRFQAGRIASEKLRPDLAAVAHVQRAALAVLFRHGVDPLEDGERAGTLFSSTIIPKTPSSCLYGTRATALQIPAAANAEYLNGRPTLPSISCVVQHVSVDVQRVELAALRVLAFRVLARRLFAAPAGRLPAARFMARLGDSAGGLARRLSFVGGVPLYCPFNARRPKQGQEAGILTRAERPDRRAAQARIRIIAEAPERPLPRMV